MQAWVHAHHTDLHPATTNLFLYMPLCLLDMPECHGSHACTIPGDLPAHLTAAQADMSMPAQALCCFYLHQYTFVWSKLLFQTIVHSVLLACLQCCIGCV